ncbi:MAG: adenylyltransferase/cytidyltransferase family protein, partial [Muribaculaceae bacterium]|nr:adenylyltransferase/cytidyltransferase family protein [Muribaculaceae bacterium]
MKGKHKKNTAFNADTEPQAPILREAPILCGKSRKVFVTGFFDMLNSGHVQFLKEAAEHGELYVGVGSDRTFIELKGRSPICSEQERLYMVKAIRHVKDAFINSGSGILNFLEVMDRVRPDILVVNSDGGNDLKRKACEERGIRYIVLGQDQYSEANTARSADTARSANTEPTAPILSEAPILPSCRLPYRIDIAGTWIDQPYVSKYGAGWAITASIEPTHEFMERGGMSTSTRNAAKKIWPFELPAYNEEMLARLVFCFENDPENKGHVSGAQDAIGICISGLSRHYYDGHYWPERIETIHDEDILSWLEGHVCLVPMFPRRPGCSVVEGKDITPEKVRDLT